MKLFQSSPANKVDAKIDFIDLGLRDYQSSLKLQQELQVKRIAGQINDTLILVEHPTVITRGRQRAWSDLLYERLWYNEHQIQLLDSSRGGRLTLHSPGQLVVYFIFKLNKMKVPDFVCEVESFIISLLKNFQIQSHRILNLPGIFIDQRKIVSLGFSVNHGVTMHGIAINVNNDLSLFESFNPCGMQVEYTMTSMEKELKSEVDLEVFKKKVINFSCRGESLCSPF